MLNLERATMMGTTSLLQPFFRFARSQNSPGAKSNSRLSERLAYDSEPIPIIALDIIQPGQHPRLASSIASRAPAAATCEKSQKMKPGLCGRAYECSRRLS